jgi:hypothetical protein
LNDKLKITFSELKELGVTEEEIQEAGGVEVLTHILWFLQNTACDNACDIDNIINQAIENKKIQASLLDAFDNFEAQKSDDSIIMIQHDIYNQDPLQTRLHILDKLKDGLNVKEVYQSLWGNNPHSALKLLLEAFFIDIEEDIPDNEEKREILKTVSLLRAFIAGADLPPDAEEEHLICHARSMYKEFYKNKDEFNGCPIEFLLDDYINELPIKYCQIAKALPVSAILKIFSEHCFYDADYGLTEEMLSEEIDIKNLMNMIETLARKFKMWQ